jgi:hypothetical protein
MNVVCAQRFDSACFEKNVERIFSAPTGFAAVLRDVQDRSAADFKLNDNRKLEVSLWLHAGAWRHTIV